VILVGMRLKICVGGPVILARPEWHTVYEVCFYEVVICSSVTRKSVALKRNSTAILPVYHFQPGTLRVMAQ
jgi:hypothetical protein